MVDSVSKENKAYCFNNTNPKKKAHRLYDKTLVVIDESLVRRLGINDDTWFEQEQLENGILLKIRPIIYPRSSSSSSSG